MLSICRPSQTLLFKLFEEIQTSNTGTSEDDVVFPCNVLTKTLGHHAVELGFVLQSIQAFSTASFFQMDINLNNQAERTAEEKLIWVEAYSNSVALPGDQFNKHSNTRSALWTIHPLKNLV